ncbi:MAG TPA: PilW family protein [Terriglobales bacterium]|nr:PilW family protein [Terriglobales bacterium]
MKRSRGFTLVELMVGITLGLLLTAAIGSVYVGVRQGYRTTTGISGESDSARFAMETLARALRSSGYIGCNSAARTTDNFQNHPAYLSSFAGNGTAGGNPVSGFEASGSNPAQTLILAAAANGDGSAGDWTPNLPSGTAYSLLGNVVAGSDVLVVYGSRPDQTPAPVTTVGTNNLTLTKPSGYSTLSGFLPAGAIAVISDCSKGTAFQVTAVDDAANTITHAANGTMNMGNANDSFAINYNSGALVYVPSVTFFYIGVGSDGDGALFKSDLKCDSTGNCALAATELAPDIENMQLLFGVNPTIKGGATSYVRADQVTGVCTDGSWNCVASVSLALLVASPLNTAPPPSATQQYSLLGTKINAPVDTRHRKVYAQTVALRNSLP